MSKPAKPFRIPLLAAIALLLAACTGPALKEEPAQGAPSYSKPRATEGILYDMAQTYLDEHGPGHSGFRLLDSSYDGLMARLALIDSAVSSLDIQTYLWYPDNTGLLILERSIRAAERGVHVRLLIDDLLTIGLDQALYELDRQPNIELRLFNPWENRGLLARGGEMIAELERLNQRMHDKLVVADGNAAIVGGRNIGDHYFGLSEAYNFHDLDLLGFGHIAPQAAGMFDHFWNSEWVVPALQIETEPDPEFAREQRLAVQEKIHSAPELESIGVDAADWRDVLERIKGELHVGTSELYYDTTTESEIEQTVIEALFPLMNQAQEELLITNAYIIPSESSIEFLQGLTDRGVTIRILTNSLASHDVPAVNSHYRSWRDDLLRAGAELYEARANPAIESVVHIEPFGGEFVGLHTKAFVVDREKVFVGSMNFDPRSARLNTEAGAFVYSTGLAEDLARVMERDMMPENAWQVFLDEEGELYWVNDEERVDKQPARDTGQRIMDKIFKIIPKEFN